MESQRALALLELKLHEVVNALTWVLSTELGPLAKVVYALTLSSLQSPCPPL